MARANLSLEKRRENAGAFQNMAKSIYEYSIVENYYNLHIEEATPYISFINTSLTSFAVTPKYRMVTAGLE